MGSGAVDFHGAGAVEVGGDHQFSVVGGSFEDAVAGGGGLARVQAEAAAVGGVQKLHRGVHQVADEDGAVGAGGQAKDRGAGSVAGGGFQGSTCSGPGWTSTEPAAYDLRH